MTKWIRLVDIIQVDLGREVIPENRRVAKALNGRVEVAGISVGSACKKWCRRE